MHLGVFTVAQKLVYSWYLMGETPLLPYKHVNIVYFVTQDVKYNIFSVPKTKRKFWITFELTRFRTIRGDSCFRLVEIYSKMKTKITAGLRRPLFGRGRKTASGGQNAGRPLFLFIFGRYRTVLAERNTTVFLLSSETVWINSYSQECDNFTAIFNSGDHQPGSGEHITVHYCGPRSILKKVRTWLCSSRPALHVRYKNIWKVTAFRPLRPQ